MKHEREGKARDAAEGRKGQTLDEQLPDKAASPGAKDGAYTHLSLAERAAREQQIGDVDAGDKQNEQRRAGKDLERRPNLIDHLLVHGHQADRPAGIALRRLSGQLGSDALHVEGGLLEGDALAQSSNSKRVSASTRRAEPFDGPSVRNQEIRSLAEQGESRRHHADQRARPAARVDRGADDVRTPTEPRAPEFIADDDDVVAALFVFGGEVGAAERWPNAKDGEEIRGGDSPNRLPRAGRRASH